MKTLIGIPERPWIDLEPHIDMQGLRVLHYDIIKGIALSDDTAPVAYGNLLKRGSLKDGFNTIHKATMSTDFLVRQAFDELLNTPAQSKDTVLRRKLIFANIAFGGYSGGWCVPIRSFTGGYEGKNLSSQTRWTANAEHFYELLNWIDRLPFEQVGRIYLFVNTPYCVTPIHTDHFPHHHRHEMMWLKTGNKKLFLYDPLTEEQFPITSSAAFFDETLPHGTEQSPHFEFSLRIDGVFTPEFRSQLGLDQLTNYCAGVE